MHGQAEAGDQPDDPLAVLGADQAEHPGEFGGDRHVDRHRLAVGDPVAAGRLDHRAEGVAEVHQPGQVVFAQVGAELAQHQLHRAAQHVVLQPRHPRRPFERLPEDVGVLLQHLEQPRVLDDRHLRGLAETAAQLPVGQGAQEGRIVDRGVGRVVGAQHVLGAERVDAGLDAHADVDLADQGGVHLDVAQTPAVDRGGEADQVAGDAAADGDHHPAPVQARLLGHGADLLHRLHGLLPLTGADHPHAPTAVRQTGGEVAAEPVPVQPVHRRAEEGDHPAALAVLREQRVVRREDVLGQVDPVSGALRGEQRETAFVSVYARLGRWPVTCQQRSSGRPAATGLIVN